MVINDQFGVRTLYPSRPGGEQKYITATGSNLLAFSPTAQVTVTPHDDSEVGRFFTFAEGPVSAAFFTSAGYRQSSIIVDHSKLDLNTGGRGYMMDPRDWRDVEMTSYVKVASSENMALSFSVRGGHRSTSRPCEAASYKVWLHYTQGMLVIAKERYFQGYANKEPLTTTAGPLDHWVGCKFVVVNRIIGGKHCVLLEVWIDANNTNSWIKRASIFDDGNDLCATGTDCSGSGPCQIINWGGPLAIYEIPTTGVSLARCSIREISYDGSFGATPPPPPPTGQPPTPPTPSPPPDNPAGKFAIPSGNITASTNDGNVPANTYDNNVNTRWAASPIPQWIKYDLGAIRRVSSVGVFWYRPFIPDPPPPPPPPSPSPSPGPSPPPPGPPTPPGSLIEGGVRMFYPRIGNTQTFHFSSSTDGRAQYVSNLPHCFVNIECTAYMNISDVDNMGEEVSIKLRGGTHSDGQNDEGSCYIMGVGYDGSVNAQWEEPHPNNHPFPMHGDNGNFSTGGDMIGRWFGIKAIVYRQGNSDHLECWLDTTGLTGSGQPANNWRLFWSHNSSEFTGQCNGNGDERAYFRMDDVSGNEEDAVDLRFHSCREIQV